MRELAQLPDDALVRLLLGGDSRALTALVGRYRDIMLRVARRHVRTLSVAEEVVQETWLAVLEGIRRFEGRSSFRSWLLRIVRNRAITTGKREIRCVPTASVDELVDEQAELGDRGGRWTDDPERKLLRIRAYRAVERALEALPARQGVVVRLRDLEDVSSEEVSAQLGLSRTNQRVLLHRGRLKVRAAVGADTLVGLAS